MINVPSPVKQKQKEAPPNPRTTTPLKPERENALKKMNASNMKSSPAVMNPRMPIPPPNMGLNNGWVLAPAPPMMFGGTYPMFMPMSMFYTTPVFI